MRFKVAFSFTEKWQIHQQQQIRRTDSRQTYDSQKPKEKEQGKKQNWANHFRHAHFALSKSPVQNHDDPTLQCSEVTSHTSCRLTSRCARQPPHTKRAGRCQEFLFTQGTGTRLVRLPQLHVLSAPVKKTPKKTRTLYRRRTHLQALKKRKQLPLYLLWASQSKRNEQQWQYDLWLQVRYIETLPHGSSRTAAFPDYFHFSLWAGFEVVAQHLS